MGLVLIPWSPAKPVPRLLKCYQLQSCSDNLWLWISPPNKTQTKYEVLTEILERGSKKKKPTKCTKHLKKSFIERKTGIDLKT